ncbi:signal transduction histidine kinase [Nakamurella sp. UYEF19]|uniref:sensor histidine kinase n=1 Tax=Nakamurella sp. UYEF19 TaxID=1756392 RepID=UPI003397CE62
MPGRATSGETAVRQNVEDAALIRHAATRIGVQIALASALAVGVAAVLAFALIRHHHGDPLAGTTHVEPATDDDRLVLNALLLAASVGVLVAGVVAFFIARRAVRPLGQALSLQRRFVADAGHELRTPLTILHTRAQLLARRIPVDEPAGQVAAQLLDDSRVLSEIVDELLLSASLTAHPGLAEGMDPAELLDDVAASMQVIADDSGVHLRSSSAPGLHVRGSRPALRRALIAMVDNAISHSVDGGDVELKASAGQGMVTLTVTDEGEGLPPDGRREEIWNRFSRGGNDNSDHATERPIGNRRFGLGLSLVREIATAHGGTVSLADSPHGRGAVATLTIPAAGSSGAR